jgi:hypothetical protein
MSNWGARQQKIISPPLRSPAFTRVCPKMYSDAVIYQRCVGKLPDKPTTTEVTWNVIEDSGL